MPVAVLDQQQRARAQAIALAIDAGEAGAAKHVQPLIAAAVTIGASALGLAGGDHHFRRL
jgi:hypothetical protein